MDNTGHVAEQLKVVCKHLEDIAKSLRLISGREKELDHVIRKPKSYAESYFTMSDPEEK